MKNRKWLPWFSGAVLFLLIVTLAFWMKAKVSWHRNHTVVAGRYLDKATFDLIGRFYGEKSEIFVWKKRMVPRWLLLSGPFIVLTTEDFIVVDSTYDFGDDSGFGEKWKEVNVMIRKQRE